MAKRGRTFNGCWTCRSRKVKCDLTKPQCIRCVKSKRECLGYGIRLGWSSPITIGPDSKMTSIKTEDGELESFQRRSIELMKFPEQMYYATYSELNEILDEIENSVTLKGKAQKGPFRCFDLANSNKRRKLSDTEKVTKMDHEESSSTPSRLETPTNNDDIFSETNNSYVHQDLINFAKLTILAIKGPDYKFNDQNMLHILYPKFYPNTDSDDDWVANAKMVNNKLYTKANSELKLHQLLKHLINNFTVDSTTLNRVGLPVTYFEVLFISYIKQIVSTFFCWDFTEWNVIDLQAMDELNDQQILHSIKLCVIYLTLGLSAFKLSKTKELKNLDNNQSMDEFLKISIELRKLSIKLLNFHLDESDTISEKTSLNSAMIDNNYDTLLLTALILQIELDGMFSVFENLDLIYAIGDFVIKNKLINSTRLTTINKFLINIFKIKYFIYESTQAINVFNYQIDENQKDYSDLKDDYNLINGSQSEDENDDEEEEEEEEEEEDNEETEDEEVEVVREKEIEQKNGATPYTNSTPSYNFNSKFKPTIENLVSTEDAYVPTDYTINFNKNQKYNAAYELTSENTTVTPNSKFSPQVNTIFTAKLDIDLIYLMFGIPQDLLNLFHETIHLANHKNIFNLKKQFPRNFPKLCTDLEDKLINWNYTKSNWKLDPTDMFQNFLINYISSFHQAVIIFHNKLMKKSFDTAQHQLVIERSLNYLIKAMHGAKMLNLNFQPMFWNLLICGSVAIDHNLQDKIKFIWSSEFYTKQSNYWRSKQILYEIWQRRNNNEYEENDLGFMNMIREWDIFLSLG
ncbi:ARG83 [Candida pseudojiufengensis]|uniref:ARG83 n=1 Tax=Candida pseudojiufengensis TaxID=497109 RepID=UPI002224C768|nr:ARG83 [Candida pseudojiufengensis]KAI5965700.1 ARG83 [Candida pseudojiufengensis]